MCYSKEVSLATSGIILASTGFSWFRYYLADIGVKSKKLDLRVRGFIKYTIIGFAMIGGHQLFEFLAIWSGNQTVYKIGLLISISFTYFLILALEKLTLKDYGSGWFMAAISALAVYLFTREARFENAHFYVRGYSHFVWSMTWMMLFNYWNLCVITAGHEMRLGKSRTLLLFYPWVFANLTYALMLVYALVAKAVVLTGVSPNITTCSAFIVALKDYQGIYDVGSIWCTLAALSTLIIPFYYRAVRSNFNPAELALVTGASTERKLVYAGLSAVILLFLNYYLPIFSFIGLKMFTK